MMKRAFLGLLLAVLFVSGSAFAQTAKIDLDASTPAVDQTLQVTAGQAEPVVANLVITGVENLLGVSADINFATDVLELTDIQATFGDLDFSGVVSFQEIVAIISFYLGETPVDTWVDPNGNKSGILVDKNRDNAFGFTEVVDAIGQYVDAENGIQYWTMDVASDAARTSHDNESVPVFDPVAKSNPGGEHPGVIEDLTAVLLRRPEGTEGGAPATGFGFDSTKYGDAIICTLKFKVRSTAPAGNSMLTFGKSVMINENFADINNDIITVPNESSTIQVQ